MENKKDIQQELEELAPKLSKLKKETPFETPGFYFERFPGRILSKVKVEETWLRRLDRQLQSWVGSILRPRHAVSAVAVVLLLIAGIHIYQANQYQEDLSVQVAELSDEELDDYLAENVEAWELGPLSENIEETGYMLPESVSEEDIREYLFNHIDEQTLEEELL